MVSNPLNLQSPLIVDVLKGQIEKHAALLLSLCLQCPFHTWSLHFAKAQYVITWSQEKKNYILDSRIKNTIKTINAKWKFHLKPTFTPGFFFFCAFSEIESRSKSIIITHTKWPAELQLNHQDFHIPELCSHVITLLWLLYLLSRAMLSLPASCPSAP